MSEKTGCKTCDDNEKMQAATPGPWSDEPNRVEFRRAGIPCIIHRGPIGVWCGYVGLPPGHPFHGQPYDVANGVGVEVHGGLTYANKCDGHICHVAQPGESDDVWWLGFDCGHLDDLIPYMIGYCLKGAPSLGGVYRDQAYVTAETKRLAEHLAEIRR